VQTLTRVRVSSFKCQNIKLPIGDFNGNENMRKKTCVRERMLYFFSM